MSRTSTADLPVNDDRWSPPVPGALTSAWRWATAVALSAGLPAGLYVLGLPGGIAFAIAAAIALTSIGDLVLGHIRTQADVVRDHLSRRASKRLEVLVLEHLDLPTHDPFRRASETIGSRLDRSETAHLTADEQSALRRTQELVSRIANGIRDSRPVREALRISGRRGTPLDLTQMSYDEPEQGDLMISYADPAHIPGWVPPPLGKVLSRLGGVLDEVRRLHSAEIEAAVLLFTLWSRFLLMAAAPLMAAATFTEVPLHNGVTANDIPYLVALGSAGATALIAPWISRNVMRRDATGAEVRRWLLVVEIPIAVAVILTSPSWIIAAYAVGWTNWWQRPIFNFIRLAIWALMVIGCMAAGAAFAGDLGWSTALEAGIAMGVIGVIGGSYGAMLPVSVSVLLRVLLSASVGTRAKRGAEAQVSRAILDLREAARLTELHAAPDDTNAKSAAQRLREIADELASNARADNTWAHDLPGGLYQVIDQALAHGLHRTRTLDNATTDAGPERFAPVTLNAISPEDKSVSTLRFTDPQHAATLAQILDVIGAEARAHGAGPLTTTFGIHGSHVRIRVANALRDPPAATGTGLGAERLQHLLDVLPGATLETRGPVGGDFIDLPPSLKRFGVELQLQLTLFKADEAE